MSELEELVARIECEKEAGVNSAICDALLYLLRKEMGE